MASFFEAQLDFIIFFYGMAFILLGVVSFAIARGPLVKASGLPFLGMFGLIHGAGEWLDLAALMIGDTQHFAIARAVVMAVSFGLLMEFARLEGLRAGLKLPGRWIYVILYGAVAFAGFFGGLAIAEATSRYFIGFVGAIGSGAVVLMRAERGSPLTRKLIIAFASAMVLYAIVAGLIVAPAPFWPANVVNVHSFFQSTGLPIQLVRGLTASLLTLLLWAIWGRLLVVNVGSDRYTAHLRRQTSGTVIAMLVILAGGWLLTDHLGVIYRHNIQHEARGDVDLLGGRIAGETAVVEAMVKLLANSPLIRSMVTTGRAADEQHAREVLQRDIDASGATSGAIFDHVGRLRVAPERSEPATDGGPYDREVLLLAVLEGRPGYRFTVNSSGAPQFDVSYPVRGADGTVAGAAVLTKSLSELEASLRNFDTAFYFLNDRGEVMLTNRPERRGQRLWATEPVQRASMPLFASPGQPLLAQEVTDSQWTRFNGQRGYVLRRPVIHGDWSLVVTLPLGGFFASRFLGIVITLQFSIMALLYFFGREYGLRDNVRMEQRVELQELAAGLEMQASTDPLTGLFNRWKFNDGLAAEIERFHRQHVPFSLVMYDIDRFKEVNDIYGHQTGDRVLVRASSIVSHALRQNDLLARWGGEEFVVLLVGDGGDAAAMVAEKLRTLIADTAFDAVGHITCSFGVAECMTGDTPDRLIARADNALYRAKLNGRNRVELAAPPMVDAPSLMPVG